MKNLYLLSLLMFNTIEEDISIIDIIENTETPPSVSFSDTVLFTDINEIVYTTTALNIRNKPNKNSNIITTVPINKEIHRIGIGDNGWSKINYEDNICFASSKYLSKQKTEIIEENKTINITSSEDIISVEGNISTNHVSLAKNYFNKIPENVRKYILLNEVHIFVTDTDLANRFFANQYNSVMGCTVYEDKTIYIENRDSAIVGSLIHETGHILDYLLGWVSSSQEFIDCYSSEKDSFVEVGKQDNNSTSSTMEYFAEVWNQSILYPESCKSSAPNSYNYVINLMNNL